MLHKETVGPGTLELIKKLQTDPILDDFFLVGGTALALQIGHRTSIDIDLFTRSDIDIENLIDTSRISTNNIIKARWVRAKRIKLAIILYFPG